MRQVTKMGEGFGMWRGGNMGGVSCQFRSPAHAIPLRVGDPETTRVMKPLATCVYAIPAANGFPLLGAILGGGRHQAGPGVLAAKVARVQEQS